MNPTNEALAQIFISYKREDEAFARRLHTYLKACGCAPWLDVEEIKPGSDWDTEIHHGLRGAQIVIGVLTPESLASRNVMDEWGYALSTGKRLFLLWLRDVDEADIPPRYIRFQRIDMRQSEASGLEQLRTALVSAAKIIPTEAETAPQVEAVKEEFREEAPVTTQQKTNRSRMLEKVKVFWIEGVLEQSLHGVALLELGIQPRTDAVENPWDTVLQHTAYGDYRLPTGTSISEIYHDLNGELLILGDPGSGKTTTLLELARERIALAEKDETEAIPVVLNLSSWADTRKPLFDWLVDELNTKYAVPRKVARGWLEADALLLLLDGLDEVLLRHRDACVAAINTFRQEHGFTRMVVCSRIVDYEALTTRLHLNGAIVLQPLNDEQIDLYLASLGGEMQGVREAMARDADLRKLAETPLMLSIMTLAFRGLTAADLPPLESVEAQRRRLFETYTTRMFVRRPAKNMSRERIMHYLTWLAGRMVERKQSVFYIENLQVDWIAGDLPQRLYRIVGRTVFGAVGGAAVGAVAGIAFVLVALLLGQSLTSDNTAVGVILAVAFSFVAVPAGVGALVFALSGLQAYALDSIPETIHPIRKMVRRIASVIAAGAGLGVVAAVLTGIGLFLVALPVGAINPEYMWASRGESFYGWGALAYQIGLGLIISIGLGAVAGLAAGAVALALKLPRRRLLTNLVFLTLYGIGGSVAIIAGSGVLALYTAGVFMFDRIMLVMFVSICGTCVVLGVAGASVPRRARVVPYVLLSLGGVVWLLITAGVSNSLSGYPPTPNVSGTIGVVMLLISAAVIGFFVGRINDQIESAEALRWRWSIRWSLVGLVATLILGLVLASTPLGYYSSYSESGERQALARIADLETELAPITAALARREGQWEDLRTQIRDFEALEPLVREQYEIEAQLAYNYGSDWQFDFEQSTAPALDCYDPNQWFYNYLRVYRYQTDAEDETAAARHAEILATYGLFRESSLDVMQETWRNLYFCASPAKQIQAEIRQERQRYTMDGLGEWAARVARLTLVLGLAFIIGGGVIGGLRKTETIDIRTRPNSGIRRTLRTAVRVTLAFGLVGAVIGGLIGVLLTTLPEGDLEMTSDMVSVIVPFCMVIGVSIGVGLGLLLGGIDAVVKHVVLRLFLQRSGSIPRHYAALLDEAADRILLRKVGGGYIFIHRYLLEYYASLERQPDEQK